jgi:phosphate transport system substrate-binding protein
MAKHGSRKVARMTLSKSSRAVSAVVVGILLALSGCTKERPTPPPAKPQAGGGSDSSGSDSAGSKSSGSASSSSDAGSSDTASDAKSDAPAVDPRLPDYVAKEDIEGRLKSVGSDTMNNLMTYWSQDFETMYPGVHVESEGKGSGTAIPAMIQGTADIGPMSRDITKQESAEFKEKFGYDPTQVRVAIDMLAVFVHKDNPIESLTFQQLDAVFSVARRRGYDSDIVTWGDLGLEGEWADKPISLYGRDPASGTYVYFKEHVLEKGDYKPTVKLLPGSSAVVQGVSGDQYGMGYSGIGYKTSNVRAVPLAKSDKGHAVAAESQYAYDGTYPLSRFLLLSVNYKPNSELSPLNAEFLKFVLSKQGQEDAVKSGFLPLPARVAEGALKAIDLDK